MREPHKHIKALETYIAQLEFFTAILLAVSVNRNANLEMLENYIRGLKPTNR